MKESYAQAQRLVLVYEGGKVDDPQDPGGRTNQGVTQRVFSAYLREHGMPARDVYSMTVAERDVIYRAQYWDRVRGDMLPAGVDFVIYDGAVNSGVAQSIKWAQRAVGVGADGVMGEITLDAIRNHPDHDALVAAICAKRMAFLKALKTWGRFGKGWSARVANVQKNGQAMATGSVGPAPVFTAEGARKASATDAKKAPARAPADALASGGVVTTTLTTVQNTLEPLATTPWVANVIVGLTVAGAVATGVGLAYGWYARKRKAELYDALDIPTEVSL